ncbi:MAG: GNAT family N-acetyltransferase [Brooklawnia sp.]|jgi:hypothetical protein
MAGIHAGDLVVRRATEADAGQVIDLLRASLNKSSDPNYEAFLAWKHHDNAFGESPAWVALHGETVVGYRTFLRWRFRTPDDQTLTAVRAVDTATLPGYRGLGIFRRLTLQGVADLTLDDVGLVFNTPNDKSRPGYLKMGWSPVRRLPVGILPRGGRSVVRMLTARVPAALWSEETGCGLDAAAALADPVVAEALLQHAPRKGLRTDRTPAYLAWRTSFGPLRYRLLLASPNDPAEGGIIFRLRRRGDTIEAAVIEQLVPDPVIGARLVTRMLTQTGADYAIGLRTGPSAGLIPLPGQGPQLTARPLSATPPPAAAWRLTLGDVELF